MSSYLAEVPSVHEENGSVWLVHLVKLERQEHVLFLRDLKVECSDEEPDASSARGKTFREVARGPVGCVKSREMPALTFAEQTTFVEDTTNFVWVAKE